ncbi:four helix bundle protein [Paludibacter jiangxiensis]|uniref:Four helix bundle protein n=1 Tax=Paludibacter jiangxiensis TaxID=681398 RepID=A0A161LIZ5_9BACT|nr:four helix bundle protein [Paludibacter jiangxiensis]GAT62496.1 four helix bundle protein [Paludibacter jiangxiensis]
MAKIERFEDIKAWQTARELCKQIHLLTQKESFSRDYRLIGQIKGSSGSVMDNIAEGFERNGNREFIQFLSIAKGSSGETRSQLYRALDNNYITKEEFDSTFRLAEEASRMISSFMQYLNQTDMKGTKFKL